MAEATEVPPAQPGAMEPRTLKRRRRNLDNPLVYFDVTVGGQPIGKIVMELFQDAVPKVQMDPVNFMIWCSIPAQMYEDAKACCTDGSMLSLGGGGEGGRVLAGISTEGGPAFSLVIAKTPGNT